ncbi:energy transducer TonB [Thermomonas carbonis]|nr:energy transducer TonB [Thermomonas carbonis]GHC03749.1 cell envelope biogenesis protein TonB [Thermomonas carbonis]
MKNLRRGLAPLALAVAITCALGACKKDAATDADAAAPAAGQVAPAPTAASVVSASVNAMDPDQLRSEASKAYGENRLYAPAGNNAMEYYLALRDKAPADAGASSALTDLLPMTVIATEQGIAREDYAEAKRLSALIEKADAQHPALARLKTAITSSETAALQRAENQKLTAEEEAKRQADLLKQREEDQRKQQEQARQQAASAATQPAATQPAAQSAAAAAEAERQRVAEAERQRAAAAEQQRQAAAAAQPAAQPARPAASSELRAIAQPGPRYPQAAQRAGATGTVQVEFTVASDGSVGNVRVVGSDAPRQYQREFEREATAAVKRWRFQPVAEATTTRRTISFQQ